MLGRAVQDRRTAPVRLAARALRQLEREDLAALERRPEPHELDELWVVPRDGVHLVADAAGLVPGTPHVEAALRLGDRELLHGLAALHAGELHADAVVFELRPLIVVQDQLDGEPARDLALNADIDAGAVQLTELTTSHDGRVDVKPQAVTSRCTRARRGHAEQDDHCRGGQAPTSHCLPPQARISDAGSPSTSAADAQWHTASRARVSESRA
jgi:hypothetical protein